VKNVFEYYGVRKNFQIVKLNYGAIKYVKTVMYGFSASQKIKEIDPDLVYGRDLYGCYFSSKKYLTIFEAHSPMSNFVNRFVLNRLRGQKKYKKTVVISDALKKILLSQQKIHKNKFFVAHDGADEVVDFDNIALLKGEVKNLKVGYIGHLYRGKGIEIIEMIADKVEKDIEFHIVGGMEKDIAFWKSKIHSVNVYFYGFVMQNEVNRYINAMDVCLLPNQKIIFTHGAGSRGVNISGFTSPLKLFEYMAHKKAVVASDIEVLREVLNEKNSILVDCESVNEWVGAIEKLKNSEIRNNLAKKAYGDFLKNYTWKNRAKLLLKAESTN
jgi:glycosyltransferase involved in cell wall biosynthesis